MAFLKLGLTSFGGPIAHLGYFRAELVERRRWLSEREYGDIVALCQFLPGPASSQVGFTLGLLRGGPLGALFAFLAFTMPSAALMVAFAFGADAISNPIGSAVLSGLKVVAVAIVAQAVWGMARTLAPDARRAVIAALAAILALVVAGSWGQVSAIVVGAVAGLVLCRHTDETSTSELRFTIPRPIAVVCLALFGVLLVGLPVLSALTRWPVLDVFAAFYGSGALVFGGGHVVLPLLHSAVVDPGWISNNAFVIGYGAAQAVPGPLFTFSGYLGAMLSGSVTGVPGAAVALAGIFLPGFLLLVGVLPFWNSLRRRPHVRAAMRGANAAVVGILIAALYTPVFTTAVTGVATFGLALVCFVLLVAVRLPPWLVVSIGAAGGVLIPAVEGRLL